MFSKQTNCDVQFHFGDETVGAHVLILSSASPMFAAMFETDMKEAKSRKVVIQDTSINTFKLLLSYIYSSRLENVSEVDTAKLLFAAADKYCLEDLKEECIDYIISCIRVDNALDLMIWSESYSQKRLQDATLTVIGMLSHEVFEQESWKEFIENEPGLTLMVTRYVTKVTTKILSTPENVINFEDIDESDSD